MSFDRITQAAIDYSDNLINASSPITVMVATEAYKAGARWMRDEICRKFNEYGGDFDLVEQWLEQSPDDYAEERKHKICYNCKYFASERRIGGRNLCCHGTYTAPTTLYGSCEYFTPLNANK